jgi:hypothetical protein
MAYPTAESRVMAAPAEAVWALISDLSRMGEWSPENTGGSWIKGATGPRVGACFKGVNRNGVRRWSTTATVVSCEPGRSFEIAVSAGPLSVANWRYEFEETELGCRVTESWIDRRGKFTTFVGRVLGDHGADHARQEMAGTLANLAAAVE